MRRGPGFDECEFPGLSVDLGLCGDLARSHPTSMHPVAKYQVKPINTIADGRVPVA